MVECEVGVEGLRSFAALGFVWGFGVWGVWLLHGLRGLTWLLVLIRFISSSGNPPPPRRPPESTLRFGVLWFRRLPRDALR